MTSEEKARELRYDKKRLRARLLEAKSCLNPAYRVYFVGARFDYNRGRLLGVNGYFLQW